MNYTDWLPTVFPEITNDPLWHMEIYRLGVFLGEIAWIDTSKLVKDPRMLKLSDQLYSAVGSISANIAEGYSKASKNKWSISRTLWNLFLRKYRLLNDVACSVFYFGHTCVDTKALPKLNIANKGQLAQRNTNHATHILL